MTVNITFKYLFLLSLISSCSSNEIKPINTTNKVVNKIWQNAWIRASRMEGAELDIDSVYEDSISFKLSATDGGHTGDLDGKAVVNGKQALYIDGRQNDSCVLAFTLSGDSIILIKQKSGDCFAGIGVNYSGEYRNSKHLKAEKKTETLVSLDELKNKQQDSIFKILVGNYYEDFLNTTEITSEDDDLDGLHTMVRSSAIRGLYTLSENIVMVDSTNQFWAAVIKNEKVYYFTNSNFYRNELPKTIENWRSNFKKNEVVYMSRQK